ncbi:MAG: ABC transporter ATP-binding protein [Pseudomonadota bacterium]
MFILCAFRLALYRWMLQLDSIHFAYGQTPVLDDISLQAEPGAVTCLVGPSGCGKSTLLRLAAGLLAVQQGEIHIDGRSVAAPGVHVPPEDRSVGLVFQEGALFPHLTAGDNIRFGLRDATESGRADELIRMTDLEGLEGRYPHELSGGQRQRVALARALAPRPKVLLFDEPYANLDQALRRQLRAATRRLVAELGTVAVFVTHDSDDISELADTVVAMHDGRVVQRGSPRALFDHPEHPSVARMYGQAQRIGGSKSGDVVKTAFGDWPSDCLAIPGVADGPLDLLVRPDGLALSTDADGNAVTKLRVSGADDLVAVRGDDDTVIMVRVARPHSLTTGSRVSVAPLHHRVFPDVAS